MLFRVKGVDFEGTSFSSTFESVSEKDLRAWMVENGISVTSISAYPLTTGPYSKLPWLILAWPVFAGLFIYATYSLAKALVAGVQTELSTIAVTVITDIILAVLIYNILLRLGSHYEFDEGRIIQYAKGECIITSKDFSE